MSNAQIPPRLKRWIFIWTPVLWVVLEMLLFPKNRPLSSGFAHVMGGFVDKRVASYPAWTLWFGAAVLVFVGLRGLRAHKRSSRLPSIVLAMAVVALIWACAQMGFTQFDLAGRGSSFSWLFQTVLLVLAAALVWVWGADNPERADLLVWNTHETWRVYRANWQGIVGLGILLFFFGMALFAPFIVNHAWLNPDAAVTQTAFAPPSFHNYLLWFGSDEQGLSVFAEFVWSSRISLLVGVLATLITTVVGAGAGIFTGYYARWIGELGMRVTDVFLVLPWLPFAMVLAAAWGQNYAIIILIIAFTSWAGTARLVRAQVLSVKEAPFVERARAIGSGDVHIMRKHILPNVMPLIFANAVLTVAIAVFSETTLSFLGLGDPLNFSWGTMLEHVFDTGATEIPTATAYLLAPGIAVVLLVLAFNLMGTAFDEVVDPKLRKREESSGESRVRDATAAATITSAASRDRAKAAPTLQRRHRRARASATVGTATEAASRVTAEQASDTGDKATAAVQKGQRIEHQGILDVRDLKAYFKLRDGDVKAVDGVSFNLEQGKSLGLAGESGCGKTTAALAILKLLPENGRIVSGEVLFDGRNLARRTEFGMSKVRWKDISIIFQGAMNALNPVRPVGKQIAEPMYLHEGLSEKKAMGRVRELFDLVGINPKRVTEFPHEMSGGMRQRAMIAMALACNPKLVIGDEPTTALDVMVQAQILELIKRLRHELGLSFILISHDLSVMAETCDTGVIMYAGKVVEAGTTADLFDNAAHPYTKQLIGAFPNIHKQREMAGSIAGDPPNLLNPPPGCRFYPRCAERDPSCIEQDQVMVEVEVGHFARCSKVA